MEAVWKRQSPRVDLETTYICASERASEAEICIPTAGGIAADSLQAGGRRFDPGWLHGAENQRLSPTLFKPAEPAKSALGITIGH